MGLDYYALMDDCEYCGRAEEDSKVYLGTQSVGFRFSFKSQQEHYKDIDSFMEFIRNESVSLIDEFRRDVSKDQLVKIIEDNQVGRRRLNYIDVDGYDFSKL
jgi:hypothetical protein